MTTAVVPLPTAPVPTSAPATPTSSLPSAVASQARLERDDLRWELRDREMMPDKFGELAAMVERVIEQASPPAGVEAVLLGIEGLAARFGLAIPDPDALEADVVELAAWPVDEWEAALDGIRCTFRSGYSCFPTIADFRAAAGRTADRLRRFGDLRRLAAMLRLEQRSPAQLAEMRRRQRERETEWLRRLALAAPSLALPTKTTPHDDHAPVTPDHSVGLSDQGSSSGSAVRTGEDLRSHRSHAMACSRSSAHGTLGGRLRASASSSPTSRSHADAEPAAARSEIVGAEATSPASCRSGGGLDQTSRSRRSVSASQVHAGMPPFLQDGAQGPSEAPVDQAARTDPPAVVTAGGIVVLLVVVLSTVPHRRCRCSGFRKGRAGIRGRWSRRQAARRRNG